MDRDDTQQQQLRRTLIWIGGVKSVCVCLCVLSSNRKGSEINQFVIYKRNGSEWISSTLKLSLALANKAPIDRSNYMYVYSGIRISDRSSIIIISHQWQPKSQKGANWGGSAGRGAHLLLCPVRYVLLLLLAKYYIDKKSFY